MDGGKRQKSIIGTPQGGVISPLLANIYLHYVLDAWFADIVKPRMVGRCSLFLFADDFVMVFEPYKDCYRVLAKRFGNMRTSPSHAIIAL